MAIYIDPPIWPAHGTHWSHLISDESYQELHEFAAQLPLPRRGFDLDHYDVPASRYEQAVELGARAVTGHELVQLLRDSGLRVRTADRREIRPQRRREYLLSEWMRLANLLEVNTQDQGEQWANLGEEVLARWNEPHRHYHDETHLEEVLLALNHIQTFGETIALESLAAAWFHDVIYTGTTGSDEADSALFAEQVLGTFELGKGLISRVGDHIRATHPIHKPSKESEALAHLLDADLSIFGANETKYRRYGQLVRAEYAHVPDTQFREGRATILQGYLDQPRIYRTDAARRLWEARARLNLEREIAELRNPAQPEN